MKKKYNDKSNFFKDWTTKKLKNEFEGYYQQINQIGCYGTKDVMALDSISDELGARGYEISTTARWYKST